MFSFQSWLDKFCRKHRNFGIPNLMFYVVMANLGVFLLDTFSLGASFSSMLTFVPSAIFQQYQFWRLFTFIFVPESGSLLFLALSLYFYYFIGNALERQWGTARFTFFYLFGIVVNILVGLAMSVLYGFNFPFQVVSMHYLNMSLFFAFASLYPDMQVLFMFVIPIKVKWLGWFNAALFIWNIIGSLLSLYWIGVILPLVAILNYLLFFWEDAMAMFGYARYRRKRQVTNFKKTTQAIKKEKGYLHKCSICGVTDTNAPDKEFRYCSKCSGYHCYCEDHINNHIHIQ